MFLFEVVLSVLVLWVPEFHKGLPEPLLKHLMHGGTMYRVCIECEIIDPIETLMFTSNDFGTVAKRANTLQKRFTELAPMPPLSECERLLPSKQAIKDALDWNRNFRNTLEARMELEPQNKLLEVVLRETVALGRMWRVVRQCHSAYLPERRSSLHQLREMIGDKNFYSGYLPPPVPIWRIPEQKR